MIIRGLQLADLDQLKEIHEKHYKNEFAFPDFYNHYLNLFVVVDDNDKVISGGGVRTIAESVIITDIDRSVKDRRNALLEILRASTMTCGIYKYDQLHAFIKGDDWKKALEKYSFHPCSGQALYRNV